MYIHEYTKGNGIKEIIEINEIKGKVDMNLITLDHHLFTVHVFTYPFC